MGRSPLFHPVASLEEHIETMAKEKEVKVEAKKSEARLAFEAVIEEYKKNSPLKYEAKKAELEAKLEAIK
jgi:hypothetical protein